MRRAEAFLIAMPGASVEALREGFVSECANNQTVLIMETLMDSKSLFLTPNCETVYNLMWLDLKDGPLVIETPPNILGMVDDHWFQRTSSNCPTPSITTVGGLGGSASGGLTNEPPKV